MRMRNHPKEVYVLTLRMRVTLFKILRCSGSIVYICIDQCVNETVGVEIRGNKFYFILMESVNLSFVA